ncbi:MAG: hypothetical protein KKB31_01010 [Nanoarchaeota archaeon]|nr:hypothetical protein [Nanoarchaeota archaeon]
MTDISKAVKKLQKTYGSLRIAGEEEDTKEYISTGNLALDLALEGGIAWGYVSEYAGLSGSGKTTILQKMLADAQKKYEAWGVWIDREKSFHNDRAEFLGIDLEKIIVLDPIDVSTVPDATKALDDILKTLPKDEYKFIVIDSISAFADTSKIDKMDMGRKSQSLHRLFRTILPYIDKKGSLNFSNHVTYKLDVMFGDKTTTTGGEGPKYYTSYRLRLDDRRVIIDPNKNNEVLGNWINAKIIKTRSGPALRDIYMSHYYKSGIPYYSGYVRLLADRNYVEPKNKQEFKSFKQTTVIYKEKQYTEADIENNIEEFPELLFDKYPEYNTGGTNGGEKGNFESENDDS